MVWSKPIYVETCIDAEMDELWEMTQNPEKHQQWDLRFSSITYLPKEKENDPQQFLYSTNIGFGLNISGKGESVKTISHDNTRSSSLLFWSDHPLSLIKKGSGYWKYNQTDLGIQFLTLYNYEVRYGFLGKLFDRVIFRPLIGWATAWSFDCMRIWLEQDIHPKVSLLRSSIVGICAMILSFVWMYQGIVPKILFPDSGELDILNGSGFFVGYERYVLIGVGILEVLFGVWMLLLGNKKATHVLNIILLSTLTVGAAWSSPLVFREPFNPVTLNICMVALSIISIITSNNLVSSSRCKRRPLNKN